MLKVTNKALNITMEPRDESSCLIFWQVWEKFSIKQGNYSGVDVAA